MTKHFKAVNKKDPGDVITFGLEDIVAMKMVTLDGIAFGVRGHLDFSNPFKEVLCLEDWLKDYEVFYQHQGNYYKYEN